MHVLSIRHVWVFCLLGRLSTTAALVCEELGDWVDPLELEFEVIISHSVGAGPATWVLCKSGWCT